MTLGFVDWLRTLGCLPLDFGADQVVQLWQAAPHAAAHKPGCLELVEGLEGNVLVLLLALFS